MWSLGEVTLGTPVPTQGKPKPTEREGGTPVLIGLRRRETACKPPPPMPAVVHAAIAAQRLDEFVEMGDTGRTLDSPHTPGGDGRDSVVSSAPPRSRAVVAALEAARARCVLAWQRFGFDL